MVQASAQVALSQKKFGGKGQLALLSLECGTSGVSGGLETGPFGPIFFYFEMATVIS